jgi:hypothetical protein
VQVLQNTADLCLAGQTVLNNTAGNNQGEIRLLQNTATCGTERFAVLQLPNIAGRAVPETAVPRTCDRGYHAVPHFTLY